MKKVELLAPAGNLEKLKAAVTYGADAVYLGGLQFGLRASAGNFTIAEMEEGIAFAHSHQAKVYVTVNIIAHNEDLNDLPAYLRLLANMGVDAVIVADPGVLRIVRATIPQMEIHLSTQASNTSWSSAQFWADYGIKRIILARELTAVEIKEMVEKVPSIDFEAFIHGAMCVSYSGRCLLSNYLTGRDANRGQCAQACRWRYNLVEENRPNEFYPIEEDERGTYFFNSKDMCTIDIIPQLIELGVKSLKIEGRMKSVHYVATVTRAYRNAIDSYYHDPDRPLSPKWALELEKPSHRQYFRGFYELDPNIISQHYGSSGYIRPYDFLGIVLGYQPDTGMALIEQRNLFAIGDEVEIMNPHLEDINFTIEKIYDAKTGDSLERAPHARQQILIPVPKEVTAWGLMRRSVE